jgi:ribosomal protein L35
MQRWDSLKDGKHTKKHLLTRKSKLKKRKLLGGKNNADP